MKKQKMPAPTGGVCRHFQKGNCHFGKKCRFLHLEPAASGTKKALNGTQERRIPRTEVCTDVDLPPPATATPQPEKRSDWHPHVFCSDIVGVITEFYGCRHSQGHVQGIYAYGHDFLPPDPTPLMLVCSTWLRGVANCYPGESLTNIEWPLIALKERQSASIEGLTVVDNKGLAELPNCVHLKSLVLPTTSRITYDGWKHLPNIPHLENLVLHEFEFKQMHKILNQMKNLRRLEFTSDLCVSLEWIAKLQWMTNLKSLKAVAEKGDGNVLSPFVFPSLESLELRNLNRPIFNQLRLLGKLSTLKLHCEIFNWTEEHLDDLRFLTKLRHLEIKLHNNLAYNAYVHHFCMLEPLSRLKHLTLAGFSEVPDEGFSFLTSMNEMESLHLLDCRRLGENSLQNISKVQGLRTLELKNCNIADDHMSDILQLRDLEHLSLSHNCSITSAGAKRLSSLTSLRFLDLQHCSNCTAGDFENAFPKTVDILFTPEFPVTLDHLDFHDLGLEEEDFDYDDHEYYYDGYYSDDYDYGAY